MAPPSDDLLIIQHVTSEKKTAITLCMTHTALTTFTRILHSDKKPKLKCGIHGDTPDGSSSMVV